MGIKKAFGKLALAVAVPGMTAGALAGFAAAPAMASTAQPHAHTIYERVGGFSNTLANSMNVQVTGGFFDNGTASLGFSFPFPTINLDLGQGTQTIALFADPSDVTFNLHQATCSGTIRVNAPIDVISGTGAYAGLTGYGTATLTGSIAVPHQYGGGCNTNISNPMSLATHLNLVATASLSADT